jgi:hypothetical protein
MLLDAAACRCAANNNGQMLLDAAACCCVANNNAQQCPDYEMQKACRLKASSVLPEYMRLRAKWLVLSFCVSGTVNRQEY